MLKGQVSLGSFWRIRWLGPTTEKLRRIKKKEGKKIKNVRYGGQGWHTFFTFFYNFGRNYYFNFILHPHYSWNRSESFSHFEWGRWVWESKKEKLILFHVIVNQSLYTVWYTVKHLKNILWHGKYVQLINEWGTL